MRSPSAETEPWDQHEPQYLRRQGKQRARWKSARSLGQDNEKGKARPKGGEVWGRVEGELTHCGMC